MFQGINGLGYAVFRIDNDWIKNNFGEVCKYIDEMVMENRN